MLWHRSDMWANSLIELLQSTAEVPKYSYMYKTFFFENDYSLTITAKSVLFLQIGVGEITQTNQAKSQFKL